jgi:hypothetical protein
VRHCLDGQRREKLSPEQVLLLLREARRIGFHAAMDFIACDVGYKAQPVDVEQQVQSLEETIAQGLQTLNAQMASLTRIRERAGM